MEIPNCSGDWSESHLRFSRLPSSVMGNNLPALRRSVETKWLPTANFAPAEGILTNLMHQVAWESFISTQNTWINQRTHANRPLSKAGRDDTTPRALPALLLLRRCRTAAAVAVSMSRSFNEHISQLLTVRPALLQMIAPVKV